MKRFALLIEASNVKGEEELPGVRQDIDMMNSYLMSLVGGVWSEDEIIKLSKPQLSEVDEILNYHRNDYCFVYFSGHGCEVKQGFPTICLNDNEQTVSIEQIYPHGNYGTIIVDCCRTPYYLEESVENLCKKIASYSEKFEKSSIILHRRAWDLALDDSIKRNSRQDIVKMIACSSGEAASMEPTSGSYSIYSHALISYANDWYVNASKKKYTSTLYIHKCIVKDMQKRKQNPTYEPKDIEYPFGVKA